MSGWEWVAFVLCFCVLKLELDSRATRREIAKTAKLLADHAEIAAEAYEKYAGVAFAVAKLVEDSEVVE